MIKKFEEGKWYRYTGTVRGDGWADRGGMDAILDGQPRRCTHVDGRYKTSFNHMGGPNDTYSHVCWYWSYDDMKLFEEYTPTESEVVNEDFKRTVLYKRGV